MANGKVKTSDALDSLVISADETTLGTQRLKRIAALVVDDEMDVGPALGEFVERGANLARAAGGAPIWRADVHRERHEEGLTTSYFFVGAEAQVVDAVKKVLAAVDARRGAAGGKGRRPRFSGRPRAARPDLADAVKKLTR